MYRHIGKNSHVYNALVLKPEMVYIGDNVRIDDFARIEGGNGVTIGDFTHISSYASILAGGTAILGKYVGMAQGSRIITGTGFPFEFDVELHPDDLYIRRSYTNIVGDYAVLSCNSVVLPGVEIGIGAVLASNSTATKPIPSWQIWGGNPAKFIKHRHPPIQIDVQNKTI